MPVPTFDSDFPGGNVEVLKIDRKNWTIIVRPELKGGSPHRGWFYFKMGNLVPGRRYTLKVVENCWAGIYSHSYDHLTWQQFTNYHRDAAFDYTFTTVFERSEVFVAMMAPYLQDDLNRLIDDLKGSPFVTVTNFWTSEDGRRGKLFTITDNNGSSPKRRIWITARMHAFEAVSSWVADGLVRWLASDDPHAAFLRNTAVVYVIPIMDIDSVQIGSSGKHRTPIDFARDAGETPHWHAIKAFLDGIRKTGVDLYLDLHGPRGEEHDVYFYAQGRNLTTAEYERDFAEFRQWVGKALPEEVPYKGRITRISAGPDDRGQSYSGTAYNYIQQKYYGKSGLRLALGIETPWGGPGGSPERFRRIGTAYGRAAARFFRGRRKTDKP